VNLAAPQREFEAMRRPEQKVILKHGPGALQRLTAGWLSSSRDAAAVTLLSSALAANVIRRFNSTCRSFSKRMAAITIMHDRMSLSDHL
jgi:hypothetical protein